ncbi:hypothetical protein [Ornithinibacillus xuwenensis]|uniref:Uncharacterized protein n=1 Tax=Ornithinibacillus xuwenensis TaxID=3144668 RepID=A0ABU9XNT4_9BACI
MKRLILIGIVFLTGCGLSSQEYEPEVEDVSAESSSIENEDVKDVIPTERTVDTGPNYPWQHFATNLITEYQTEGEIVYLFSDAEALERDLIEDASRDDEGNEQLAQRKEKSVKGFAIYLDQFINEVSQHIDNEAYFNKLREVEQALLTADYQSVIDLVNEAKQIRESN